MDRSIENINKIAKELYKKYWGMELDIPVIINTRNRIPAKYVRKYIYSDGKRVGTVGDNIQFNKHLIENYTDDGLIDVLKHELCHHACFVRNKPYKDKNEYFESELKRIDACSHNHTSDELIARGHARRIRK